MTPVPIDDAQANLERHAPSRVQWLAAKLGYADAVDVSDGARIRGEVVRERPELGVEATESLVSQRVNELASQRCPVPEG